MNNWATLAIFVAPAHFAAKIGHIELQQHGRRKPARQASFLSSSFWLVCLFGRNKCVCVFMWALLVWRDKSSHKNMANRIGAFAIANAAAVAAVASGANGLRVPTFVLPLIQTKLVQFGFSTSNPAERYWKLLLPPPQHTNCCRLRKRLSSFSATATVCWLAHPLQRTLLAVFGSQASQPASQLPLLPLLRGTNTRGSLLDPSACNGSWSHC